MMRLLADWRLWLTTAFLLLVILLGAIISGNADRADRALDQTDEALAELQRVRADAVQDRRAFQAQVDDLNARVDDLLGEARLLRAQVDALSGQVRDLGGEPAPPPRQLDEPAEPPDDFEPDDGPDGGEGDSETNGGSASASTTEEPHPSESEGQPAHAGEQGPPDHAEGNQR